MKIITRSEARTNGLKRFYSGKSCPYGHVCERLVSNGTCIKCSKKRIYIWYKEKTKRKIIVGSETRDQAKKEGKARYNTKKPCSKGHFSERRTSDAKCMDCVKIKNKKRNKENKEYIVKHIKKWKLNNKEAIKASEQKRRTKDKNSFTKDDIKEMRKLQRDKCVYCKTSILKGYHVDHIMPLALGGGNEKWNVQLLCPTCNLRKGAKHPEDWANQIGFLL